MRHARADYAHIQDPSGKIPEDEPVFILRGQDMSAPATLHFWAEENLRNGGDKSLSDLAIAHALRMSSWPKKKPADG